MTAPGSTLRRVARRLAKGGGGREARLDAMAGDLEQTARLVAEMNHVVVQLSETVRHQSARLDELLHLARHLDQRFEQTREHVEILSALSLALQREAERRGLLPEDTAPTV